MSTDNILHPYNSKHMVLKLLCFVHKLFYLLILFLPDLFRGIKVHVWHLLIIPIIYVLRESIALLIRLNKVPIPPL
jgi:hypothetical protein